MKHEVKGNILSPLPIALVGSLVNGKPNYLVIGYISPFNFGKHVFFSIYKKRHTRIGVLENRTFSVNIPSESIIAETKICGSKSGRDFDKSTLFDNFYGSLKTAPMISQCPLNMECELVDVLDYDPNEGIIGRVVQSYVDEECLMDGTIDLRKVNPFVWASGYDYNYYQVGAKLP
ncbi:MAG: flavin reductase family protein [Candidatus Thorarchaeota archaeon]